MPVTYASLGDPKFLEAYAVDYPLYTGAMAKGISSADLVIAAGRRRMLASFGAGGLPLDMVEIALDKIQAALPHGPFAVNLIHSPFDESLEKGGVDLFLRKGVRIIEASAFTHLTLHLVRFRVAGLEKVPGGGALARNKIIFKVSRTELAEMAMRPPPASMVQKLLAQGLITQVQAELAPYVPMADDVAVEADSGGHTDRRPFTVIFPLIVRMRDRLQDNYKFHSRIRVGIGGGIGCPGSAVAAFQMGAAFLVTGTINQRARQSGTCDQVRKVLAAATYSDVTMCPAADMFDEGVQLQVLKKGTMFPARARKLYDLFCRYNSLDEIPVSELARLERTIFRQSVAEVWAETTKYYTRYDTGKIERAEQNPKLKMSLVFRWYLSKSSGWANRGENDRQMDYQIWCGPAIGAFNAFVKGSVLDASVSKEYPCIVQVNLHVLRGACYNLRLQQLRQLQGRLQVPVTDMVHYVPVGML